MPVPSIVTPSIFIVIPSATVVPAVVNVYTPAWKLMAGLDEVPVKPFIITSFTLIEEPFVITPSVFIIEIPCIIPLTVPPSMTDTGIVLMLYPA